MRSLSTSALGQPRLDHADAGLARAPRRLGGLGEGRRGRAVGAQVGRIERHRGRI